MYSHIMCNNWQDVLTAIFLMIFKNNFNDLFMQADAYGINKYEYGINIKFNINVFCEIQKKKAITKLFAYVCC